MRGAAAYEERVKLNVNRLVLRDRTIAHRFKRRLGLSRRLRLGHCHSARPADRHRKNNEKAAYHQLLAVIKAHQDEPIVDHPDQ